MALAEAVQPAEFLGVVRSFSGRAWRLRLNDERAALMLAQRLGVPEIMGRVLAARGIGADAADAFLNPTLRRLLPDPSHLLDMDRAADRLARAVVSGEPIGVFGDYDVDGATSTALLLRFLRAVGARSTFYIPDRLREGYGPNEAALAQLRAAGVSLVVTVDCGTTAHRPLQAAARLDLDVVVVDHHVAEPLLPPAVAVVNPNRTDEQTPHTQLAAAGVTFLLVVAVNRRLRQEGWFRDRPEPDLRQWLDLVALGTVCDIVPLTGLNRVLVSQGLKVLAARGNPGLAALADIAGLKGPPGTYHAGFILGPRVNAGGRVGRSDLGARLLSTDDGAEAAAIAQVLDACNRQRQDLEQAVLEAAQAQLADHGDRPVVLVAGAGWHPGVVGIVASRLKELWHRPACVLSLADGSAKGSGRSVAGFALGPAVMAARQAGLAIEGGGHAMAAGFTVAAERVPEFHDFLAERAVAALGAVGEGPLGRPPRLGLDGALAVEAATPGLVEMLGRAGPFGVGCPEPRFAFSAVRIVRSEVVGAGHVRCILAGGEGGTARLKGIAFRCADGPLGRALLARDGLPMHLAGQLRVDSWQGADGIQLCIDDAAPVAGG